MSSRNELAIGTRSSIAHDLFSRTTAKILGLTRGYSDEEILDHRRKAAGNIYPGDIKEFRRYAQTRALDGFSPGGIGSGLHIDHKNREMAIFIAGMDRDTLTSLVQAQSTMWLIHRGEFDFTQLAQTDRPIRPDDV